MIKKIKIKFNNLFKEISYNFKFARCFGQPYVFAIETTNQCNLKCIMYSEFYHGILFRL